MSCSSHVVALVDNDKIQEKTKQDRDWKQAKNKTWHKKRTRQETAKNKTTYRTRTRQETEKRQG